MTAESTIDTGSSACFGMDLASSGQSDLSGASPCTITGQLQNLQPGFQQNQCGFVGAALYQLKVLSALLWHGEFALCQHPHPL